MFDKIRFAQIIKNIKETYSSQEDFSKKSGIGRTYLSQYMNMKLNEPPKPKILDKLANASHNLTTYEELMTICGYIDNDNIYKLQYLSDKLENTEKYYLDKLFNFNLSKEEESIFDDLIDIIPFDEFKNCSNSEIVSEIKTYFENMDYINETSKNKIIEKVNLFANYCIQTSNLKKDIIQSKNKSKDEFTLQNETLTSHKYYLCPVYGQISAGQPNWAEECIDGYLPIDPNLMNIVNPDECFFLKVNGESMNKIIRNGAYALIRKTDFIENGEIAVVLVNRI